MATLHSARGRRVVELFQGATVEQLPTTRFQQDYEVMRLSLTPLEGSEQVTIARAISAGGRLSLTPQGTLVALATNPPLPKSLERRIRAIQPQTYTVEVRWSLDRRHPRIYSLSPKINSDTRSRNRHLYLQRHPDCDAQALCVYAPHYGQYQPDRDDIGLLVLWISAYLTCDAIQVATGHWVGPQASHNLNHIEQNYPDAECHCGSGRAMAFCHGIHAPPPAAAAWRQP